MGHMGQPLTAARHLSVLLGCRRCMGGFLRAHDLLLLLLRRDHSDRRRLLLHMMLLLLLLHGLMLLLNLMQLLRSRVWGGRTLLPVRTVLAEFLLILMLIRGLLR